MTRDPYDPGVMPDGPISGLLAKYDQRRTVVRNHTLAEGHDLPTLAVLRGYHRAEHPLTHRVKNLSSDLAGWLK